MNAKFGCRKFWPNFSHNNPLAVQIFRPLLLRFVLASNFLVILLIGIYPIHAAAITTPVVLKQQTKNYAFMQTTAAWLGTGLSLNYGLADFDLSAILPLWRAHKLYYYNHSHQSRSLYLTPITLEEIIWTTLKLQNPWAAFSSDTPVLGFDLDLNAVYNFLSKQIAPAIEHKPQDAKLTIVDGRATEFVPSIMGTKLDIKQTFKRIKLALFTGQSQTDIAVNTVQPKIQLADTNNLGIQELVAVGESDFSGSSASRVHNIRTGAAKFEGIILKPGEEFSFNHYLGPVSAEAGFKPELVIKSTGTVPEFGGGLCQVSTTAFRAALYGGLPITARKNHSYAVKYYAPQGTDATIYPGAVDFKFQNNTPAHLLIHTRIENTKLYFEYYGTKDNRKVVVDGPYQYDFKPGGAMKARLTRTVVSADGKSSTEDFFSKYVSKDLFPTIYEFPRPAAEPSTTTSPNPPGSAVEQNLTPGNNTAPAGEQPVPAALNILPNN